MEKVMVKGRVYRVTGEADLSALPNMARHIESIRYLEGARRAAYALYTRKDGSWYMVAASGRTVAQGQ